ncbi:ABC transporter permease subunit [Streptococcus iniae]
MRLFQQDKWKLAEAWGPYPTTMRKVILPQAIKVMLPNFINQFVISLKDTTIVSAIGLVELFQTGKIIIARNYQSFPYVCYFSNYIPYHDYTLDKAC